MNWIDVFKFLITVTGISTTVGYVARKLIDKGLDAGLEKYKISLNKELERFKSELDRINTEHHIKYDRLSEQRADKIRVLYTSIYELEKKLKLLTSVFQGSEWATDNTRHDDVNRVLDILTEELELNRIYFSDDFCKKIDVIIDGCIKVLRKMDKAKRIETGKLLHLDEDSINMWADADDFVQTEMLEARLDLIKEFHKIIGVS